MSVDSVGTRPDHRHDEAARVGADGSEAALRSILHGALDQMDTGFFFFDRQWRLLFTNREGRKLIPKDGAVLGLRVEELDPHFDSSPYADGMRRAAADGAVHTIRRRSLRLGGWYEVVSHPTEEGVAVSIRDVSEEESSRVRLAETLKRLRRKADLLDSLRDAAYVLELDHTVSYWNLAAERLYGLTADDLDGVSVRGLFFEDPADFDAAMAEVLATGAWMGETSQVAADGRTFIVDCRWRLVREDGGEPVHVICTISHESEQQRTRERRYRAQRLESLGLLAGGIAHNLNNVLAPLLLTAQFVSASESDPTLKSLLQSMEPTIARGTEMIQQVLAYSGGEEGRRTRVDLRPLLTEVEVFCRDTLPKSIVIEPDVRLENPVVVGDATQIKQVLVNFVTNARDAMPDGGGIRLRAYNLDLNHAEQGVVTSTAVALEVTDTGRGMDAATVTRAFEPFFSTKDIGLGTGLGLSTSLAIAHGHGGELEIDSTPGEGTTVRLVIPAIEDTTGDTMEEPAPALDVRGDDVPRRTVLVVEDEEPFRLIVQRTLESHGYATLGAAHGGEAVELVESGEHTIDLVFTDMLMPVMDGKELEAYLHRHHPELPLIAVSGFTAQTELTRALRDGVHRFLDKPFSTDELLDAVQKAFADQG